MIDDRRVAMNDVTAGELGIPTRGVTSGADNQNESRCRSVRRRRAEPGLTRLDLLDPILALQTYAEHAPT